MPLDPLGLLAVSAAVAIVSIVGTLATQWITARFAQHGRIESLKAESLALQKSNSELQAKVAQLVAEKLELQTQYDACFSEEAIRAKYTFSQRTGTYLLNDAHFCSRC